MRPVPLQLLARVDPLPFLSTDATILQIAVACWLGLDGHWLAVERGRVGAMAVGDVSPNNFKLGTKVHC